MPIASSPLHTRRRWPWIALVALGALALGASQLPYRDWLERRLIATLEAQGLSPVALTVSTLGWGGVTLADISAGGALPFTLAQMEISLRPMLRLPLTWEVRASLPGLHAERNGMRLATGAAELSLLPQAGASPRRWDVALRVEDIRVTGVAPLPDALRLMATGTLDDARLTLAGHVRGVGSGAPAVDWRFDLPREKPEQATLTIERAHLPWGGGQARLENVLIPLQGGAPITTALIIDGIRLDALLKLFAEDKVSATGKAGGRIPLTIARDGRITLGEGKVSTVSGSGALTLAPDAIPAGNAHMEMLKTALADFRYASASLETSADARGRPLLTLRLTGHSPNAFEGREIKLRVNLSGDVLESLRSTFAPLNDPRQLLEEDTP